MRKTGWIVMLGLVLAGSAGAAEPGAEGYWLDQTGKAVVDIAPCGEKLCGHIVWLRNPLDAQGKPKTDIHNADPGKQSRPLCGLEILNGFDPDGTDEWSGGTIYDPERGETYKSTMRLADDGTLRVRGYVGITLFGRSETWTRVKQQPEPCKA